MPEFSATILPGRKITTVNAVRLRVPLVCAPGTLRESVFKTGDWMVFSEHIAGSFSFMHHREFCGLYVPCDSVAQTEMDRTDFDLTIDEEQYPIPIEAMTAGRHYAVTCWPQTPILPGLQYRGEYVRLQHDNLHLVPDGPEARPASGFRIPVEKIMSVVPMNPDDEPFYLK
jgi:hypothetical protein